MFLWTHFISWWRRI